ncbi:UDP-glucose 4-epimerase [Cyclonatronum proteinivorum]|uniref:UDP-glucose 4-epimerase n=1 Tax=Cyclonatronum proteinivorum TaxID=1457365 RepID=A0A345UL89_9BACT|nr:UDP-glucose 4-epimerase GalE [Cyclonatronum proteinivorum]AXJ01241.1 UDP-glucose 4-epimerase [Cyclonatronum proteinivorum]
MKILVTGGLGYIGSHTVVELHLAGHDIVILDNLSNSMINVHQVLEKICGRSLPFYEADIMDDKGLREVFEKESGIDGIIHFAAKKSVSESLDFPVMYYENNIKGLINVMRMVEDYKVPYFVFSSSCTVYGEPDNVPVTESTPTTSSPTPYGNSKLWAELMITEFTKLTPHVKSVLLRYFNPVGAHESALIGELPRGVPSNLMPFITQTAAGWREQLSIFGQDYNTPDGTCIRDFIHVVDLAKAHVISLDYARDNDFRTEIFNVGTGNGHSVSEVVESFERSTGVKLNYRFAPRRQGDVEKIWADTTKVTQVLGWKPEYSLDDMSRTAWKWQLTLGDKP